MKFVDIVISEEFNLRSREQQAGSDVYDLAPTLEKLGYAYHALNRLDDAQQAYERALKIRLANGQANTDAVIPCIHALGLLHRLQDHFPDAEMYYRHALDLSTAIYGANDMETSARQNYLAGLYYAMGRFEEAVPLINRSGELYAEKLGKSHSAVTLCLLAQALTTYRMGQKSRGDKLLYQAQRNMEDTLEYREEAQESNAEILKFVLVQLRQENLDDAEALFRFALVRETDTLWPNHPLVAKNLKRLGDLNRSLNHMERAADLYRQSLEMYMSTVGITDPDIAVLAESFSQVLIQLNKRKEAVWPMRLALDVREMFVTHEPEQYEKTKLALEKLNASLN